MGPSQIYCCPLCQSYHSSPKHEQIPEYTKVASRDFISAKKRTSPLQESNIWPVSGQLRQVRSLIQVPDLKLGWVPKLENLFHATSGWCPLRFFLLVHNPIYIYIYIWEYVYIYVYILCHTSISIIHHRYLSHAHQLSLLANELGPPIGHWLGELLTDIAKF